MNESDRNAQIARIVEAQRAGRECMDDYRAVIVRGGGTGSFSGNSLMMLYRKGTNFRTDRLATPRNLCRVAPPNSPSGEAGGGNGHKPGPDLPQDRQELGERWMKRVQDLVFVPIYIDRGLKSYHIETRVVTDRDGSEHVEIGAVQKHSTGRVISPAYYSLMPEFACRSFMGIPGPEMDTIVDLNPADGPPRTILLHMRRIGPKLPPWRNRQGNLVHHTTQWRYWLDPARDCISVRMDMICEEESGNETTHSTVIDETAQSPTGIWYATRIRRVGASWDQNGQRYDEISDLYLDFDSDLADSLFDLPTVGRRVY